MKIARYLDAAILKPDMSPAQVEAAIKECISYDAYTVCVRGCDIALAKKLCEGTDTKVSCVLDFPYGYGGAAAKRETARIYSEMGVFEIDMVMNYGAARGGEGLGRLDAGEVVVAAKDALEPLGVHAVGDPDLADDGVVRKAPRLLDDRAARPQQAHVGAPVGAVDDTGNSFEMFGGHENRKGERPERAFESAPPGDLLGQHLDEFARKGQVRGPEPRLGSDLLSDPELHGGNARALRFERLDFLAEDVELALDAVLFADEGLDLRVPRLLQVGGTRLFSGSSLDERAEFVGRGRQGLAELARGGIELARGEVRADVRGGNDLVAAAEQLVAEELDAPLGAPAPHDRDRRGAAAPQAKIAPHVDGAHVAAGEEDVREEGGVVEARERAREGDDEHRVHTRGGEQGEAVRAGGELRRRARRDAPLLLCCPGGLGDAGVELSPRLCRRTAGGVRGAPGRRRRPPRTGAGDAGGSRKRSRFINGFALVARGKIAFALGLSSLLRTKREPEKCPLLSRRGRHESRATRP